MIERLSFAQDAPYVASEAAIHLNRYAMTRQFCKGRVVLDAACGEGYGSYLMKTWGALRVEGVDISGEAIDHARAAFHAEGLRYTKCDVLNLPFEDNSFDLVVSFETMEHVDDAEQFLHEIKRVLKPDGTVLLSCPNDHYYYENDHLENPFHKKRYTFFEFKELSESILGNQAEYFFSFATDGFVNIPYEERTEPEQTMQRSACDLFHYVEQVDAYLLPQERYLNQWNCNYYLGIWSNEKKLHSHSTAFFARETFWDHRDKDYELLHDLSEREKAQEIKHQKETMDIYLERDRLKTLLDFEQKRNEMQQAAWNAAQKEITDIYLERDRLKTLLDFEQKKNALQQAAWNEAQAQLGQYQKSMAEINASRGMKLLRLYSRIRAKLDRIFKRNRI